MTNRITVTVRKGVVSEVIIPDDADVEVEVIDFDTDDQDNNSELHTNPVGYKVLYQLSTDDIKTIAGQMEEDITEEQMEYLTGEGGQRYVEKALESGLDGWDMCIQEGIIGALEEFNKEGATKATV